MATFEFASGKEAIEFFYRKAEAEAEGFSKKFDPADLAKVWIRIKEIEDSIDAEELTRIRTRLASMLEESGDRENRLRERIESLERNEAESEKNISQLQNEVSQLSRDAVESRSRIGQLEEELESRLPTISDRISVLENLAR